MYRKSEWYDTHRTKISISKNKTYSSLPISQFKYNFTEQQYEKDEKMSHFIFLESINVNVLNTVKYYT